MYFSTNKEDAFCDSCVRKNAETCSELHNPNNRYLRSEHGNKLSIKPDSIKLEGATKQPLSISLDENEGIQILSNKSITLTAKDSIEFNTPKKINIKAETKLVAQKTKSETSLYIEGSHNFLGADVVPQATQRETYPPYDDDEPEVAPEKPFNLLELMGSALAAVATVAVIGIGIAATVATYGAGATVAVGFVAGALALISAATKPKALTDAIFAPEYPIDGEATTGAMGYFKEEVEEPTMLSVVGNLLGGIGDGVNGVVTGIYDMCRHPIRTTLGLGQMLLNPIPVLAAIDEAIGDSFVKNVIHGDANTRARFLGRAGFEIGTIVLPTKVASIGKIEKLAQAQKVQMAFKGIELVKGISKTKAFAKVTGIIEKADLVNKLNKLKLADDILKGIKNVPASVVTKIDDIVEKAKKIPEKIGNIEVPVPAWIPELVDWGQAGFHIEKITLSEIHDNISKMIGGAEETAKKNIDEIAEGAGEAELKYGEKKHLNENIDNDRVEIKEGKRNTRSENSLRRKLENRKDAQGNRIYSDEEVDAIMNIRNSEYNLTLEDGEKIPIKRHGYQKNDAVGQSHHLNQDAAYREVIPREEGLAIDADGNIFIEKESSHYKAHETMEGFWDEFRKGGEMEGSKPTVREYNYALKDSLVNAGFSENDADLITEISANQQRTYGLTEVDEVPRIPGRINAIER
ncbi:hypothetical protein [Tepidibacter sp. Z1-5]|uniref:hypothetical protein n=1 Tax=Tepidibacter sp. Z1-5 TaxID=3134138 RepID=UPI0030C16A64